MSGKKRIEWCRDNVLSFFECSDYLDRLVLRPISHVAPNWELTASADLCKLYEEENGSLASHLNVLINQISTSQPPEDYHAYENEIAKNYTFALKGKIFLKYNYWYDSVSNSPVEKDYIGHMMEQATCGYDDIPELVLAASGRVAAAMKHGCQHFDDLSAGHMEMLAIILMTIIFRRSDWSPNQYLVPLPLG